MEITYDNKTALLPKATHGTGCRNYWGKGGGAEDDCEPQGSICISSREWRGPTTPTTALQTGAGKNPDFFRIPLDKKIKGSQLWFWRPVHLSPLHWCSRSSQFPAGIRRAPLAHGQAGNFHVQTWALVRFIYAGMSSPVRCLSLPGDKCPRLPFTSRCAESLSEIKPLYSKVNDACFAVQSLCLLSTVPITECRCHRWCNSIVVKGFRPPFFERVIFSLNSNQIPGLNWLSRVRSWL